MASKGGRPPAPPGQQRINVPLRLPRSLVEWIDAQGGTRAALIEAAIRAYAQRLARKRERMKGQP